MLEPMDTVRSVSVGIWCGNGSVNESPGEEGISHFIEHMLFKGTENRSTFDIVNEIDSIGGQMNAFTGKEQTCFYVKSLDEHFRKSADVLTDMICHPLFDPEEMEKEKQVVIEEINMNLDDPDDVALDNLEDAVCRGTGMAHPVLGSKETVSSFTHEKVSEYYFSHYTRDEIFVSVAGSFDEDEVISYFDGCFGELRPHRESTFCCEAPDPDNREKRTITKDIEQAHLALGISTFPGSDRRRFPLELLSSVLGGGMSSRLFQNVREKKGLAYSVYSMTGFYKSSGLFVISAGVAMDRTEEAVEAIGGELDKLREGGITKEEFMSSREQLKSSLIFSRESVQSRMIANGRSLHIYGRTFSQDEALDLIDGISMEDIEEVSEAVDHFDRYTLINVTGRQ